MPLTGIRARVQARRTGPAMVNKTTLIEKLRSAILGAVSWLIPVGGLHPPDKVIPV